MGRLSEFKNLIIEWDLTPEDAVTLYLEWGNNNFKDTGKFPVRSKNDNSNYFVINTWETPPKVFLINRNSDRAVEMAELDLREDLREAFLSSVSYKKGVYPLPPEVRKWLECEIYE